MGIQVLWGVTPCRLVHFTDVSKALNLSNIQEDLCLPSLVLLSKGSTAAARLIRVKILTKHMHVGLSSRAEGNFVYLLLRPPPKKKTGNFRTWSGDYCCFLNIQVSIHTHTHARARHKKPGVFPLVCLNQTCSNCVRSVYCTLKICFDLLHNFRS